MKRLYSNIKRIFSVDLLIRLNEITYEDETNRVKGEMIQTALREAGIEFLALGSGTNRLGIQIGEYVYKFALDAHGKMDNRREYKYTDKLQPYVIKVYECTVDGLIMCCEAVAPISENEFQQSRTEILEILSDISTHFLIGDIGFDPKNYVNWGMRKTTKSIVILDFAYVYSVKYNVFQCTCQSKSTLVYDDNYVKMICPSCGRVWSFGEIRKRISKEQERKEVGDIRDNSYVLKGPTLDTEEHPEYTYSIYARQQEEDLKKKKKQEAKEKREKILSNIEKRREISINEFGENDPKTFDELVKKLTTGSIK